MLLIAIFPAQPPSAMSTTRKIALLGDASRSRIWANATRSVDTGFHGEMKSTLRRTASRYHSASEASGRLMATRAPVIFRPLTALPSPAGLLRRDILVMSRLIAPRVPEG